MKFSTRTDVMAPIDRVFEEITNFPRFERQALRRGIITRNIAPDDNPENAGWDVEFTYRGKARKVTAKVTQLARPENLVIESTGGAGLEGTITVELVELNKTKSRMKVGLEILPRSLKARLFVQSMKLAKPRLERNFAERVAEFGKDIQARSNA